jgi:hypothetical protein
MRDSIIDKLSNELLSGVDTEPKVVYLLCEMRKLLDNYPPPEPKPFTFKLFCNWALHINLDREHTTKQFLQELDDFIYRFIFTHGISSIPEETPFFQNLVNLNNFRKEFKNLLTFYGLPTEICNNDSYWLAFLKAYAGVIEDGSLTCAAKQLKMFTKVVFSKDLVNVDALLPFAIKWSIYLKPVDVFRKKAGGDSFWARLEIELRSDGKSEGALHTFLKLL